MGDIRDPNPNLPTCAHGKTTAELCYLCFDEDEEAERAERDVLRIRADYLQRIANEVDCAHDDETVKELRRRIYKIPIVPGKPKTSAHFINRLHRVPEKQPSDFLKR